MEDRDGMLLRDLDDATVLAKSSKSLVFRVASGSPDARQ